MIDKGPGNKFGGGVGVVQVGEEIGVEQVVDEMAGKTERAAGGESKGVGWKGDSDMDRVGEESGSRVAG